MGRIPVNIWLPCTGRMNAPPTKPSPVAIFARRDAYMRPAHRLAGGCGGLLYGSARAASCDRPARRAGAVRLRRGGSRTGNRGAAPGRGRPRGKSIHRPRKKTGGLSPPGNRPRHANGMLLSAAKLRRPRRNGAGTRTRSRCRQGPCRPSSCRSRPRPYTRPPCGVRASGISST